MPAAPSGPEALWAGGCCGVLDYRLKKRIGKTGALLVATAIEKAILIFGREQIGDRT